MAKFSNKIFFNVLISMATVFSVNEALALNSGSGLITVRSGNVVSVWQAQDSLGNTLVQGATGTVFTSPSTWTTTNISDSLGASQNLTPSLAHNAAGDVIALWEYVDANSNFFVAASVLPAGATGWTTATISSNTEYPAYSDQKASVDESGNILALWSSYSSSASETQVRGATAVMGPNIVWSAPFQLSP